MTKTKEALEALEFIRSEIPPFYYETIRAALTNALKVVTCLWVHDETSEIFETSCAHSFHFVAGEIKENGFVFCPYCGNKIVREK